MTNKSYQPNRMIHLAGILLCLVMISFNLMSGIYARYSVTASSSDSARVAKFDIHYDVKREDNTTTAFLNIDLTPGATRKYELQVKNASEVAVNYTLSAQLLTANLPLEMTLTGQNAAKDGKVWTGSGSFAPNADGVTYTLEIKWAGDTSAKYAGEVDAVRVVVRAEQID